MPYDAGAVIGESRLNNPDAGAQMEIRYEEY